MMALFIRLLLKANHKDSTWRGIEIKRGQLVTGLHSLANQTGIPVQRLRTCLSRLERGGEISRKSTNKFTIITICNFNKYQEKPEEKQQTNNNQTTNNQQQRKNNKNKNTSPEEDHRFMEFWSRYPRKTKRPDAYRAWKKHNCGKSRLEEVMSSLNIYINGPWHGKDKQFIPYPASWLNGEPWNDEIEATSEDNEWI